MRSARGPAHDSHWKQLLHMETEIQRTPPNMAAKRNAHQLQAAHGEFVLSDVGASKDEKGGLPRDERGRRAQVVPSDSHPKLRRGAHCPLESDMAAVPGQI